MSFKPLILIVTLGLGAFAVGQEAPQPRDNPPGVGQGGNPRPRGEGLPPRGPDDRPPRPDQSRPDPQRPDDRSPGNASNRPLPARPGPYEAMNRYLESVDHYTHLTMDPAATGVAAVVTANDLLRPKGPEAGIRYFNDLLPQVKNEAVQRAIRLQLVELYRASGQTEKALDQLQQLIVSAPAGEGRRAEGNPPH